MELNIKKNTKNREKTEHYFALAFRRRKMAYTL